MTDEEGVLTAVVTTVSASRRCTCTEGTVQTVEMYRQLPER